jgi:hypothetical protein
MGAAFTPASKAETALTFDVWEYMRTEMHGPEQRAAMRQQRQIDAFGNGPSVLEWDGASSPATIYTYQCDGSGTDYYMRANTIFGTPEEIRRKAEDISTFMGHPYVDDRTGPGDPTAPEIVIESASWTSGQ